MAITSAERTKILYLVVGMFNAAPGELYLNEIVKAYENDGHNLSTLAKQLAGVSGFDLVYPPSMLGSEFAAAFLTPLGLQGNADVVAWISGRYNSGENKGTIILDALIALMSSTSTDAAVVSAQGTLTNKVEVAEYYSVTKGLSDPDLADLQLVLAGVTSDHASVVAAEAVIDGVASAGQTFTLLHTQDHVVGTELNDTIEGIVDGEFSTDNTFTLGDSIEGNGGFDLFHILTDQINVNFLGKTVTEVEAFSLDVVNGTDFDLLNLNNVAFETAVANFNGADELDGMAISGVNMGTALTAENVTLDGNTLAISFGAADAVDANVSLTNVDDGEVDFDFGQATAAGALTLNLDGVDDLYIATTPNDDDIGTAGVLELNVNVNGDSTGVSISNYANFADDSASIVNLVLNADLQADWWDLADNDEGTTTTFNINGAGNLTIDELDDGGSKLTIVGGTATGDLDITVGTASLIAATTGSGDDRIAVDIDDGYFVQEGQTADIDLGTGANTIALNNNSGDFGSFDINSITFDDGTVLNAQTLELNNNVTLDEGGAELDITGLGAGVGAVHITGSLQGNGNTFSFPAVVADDPLTTDVDESDGGSPATLALNVDGFIDWVQLNTGDVLNMSVSASGELDLDSVTSDVLQTLTLDDADPDEGSAVIWLDLDGTEGNLADLTTLTVNGDGYVNIGVAGQPAVDAAPATPGTPAVPGTKEVTSFTVSKIDNGDGRLVFSSAALGTVNFDYTANSSSTVAGDIRANASLLALFDISGAGDNVVLTAKTTGNMGDLTITDQTSAFAAGTGAGMDITNFGITNGTADTPATPGTPATEATDASGFEALANVNITSGDSTDLTMNDAYGAFSVTIDSGANIGATLTSTGVTSITADAADYADVEVHGAADLGAVAVSGTDVVVFLDGTGATSVVATADATEDDTGNVWVNVFGDNDDLASITATGWTANIDLSDGLDSLASLDLSGVVTAATVDATGADFGTAFVVNLSEENLTYATNAANADRETFEFDGDNTGTISISGFFQSVGGTGDRIDFSHMTGTGINNIDDLAIVYDGNTHITSLVDGVDVDITVVGVDLSQDAFYFVF